MTFNFNWNERKSFTLQFPVMRTYLVKTPRILKTIYSSCIWHFPNKKKEVYLSFDDGPHPIVTPFVLDELKKYDAKATFFCLGKNVLAYPKIYQRILDEGHTVGNHTFDHLNGWKVSNNDYIDNINEAAKYIKSNLFRPPYGRITPTQIKLIKEKFPETKIIMWDVLSGDFDTKLSPKVCLRYCIEDTVTGSIIVMHDSEKAFDRVKYVLPRLLRFANKNGWCSVGI
jgi:peptidoglycan-N-acetylglucosamine deacetylase